MKKRKKRTKKHGAGLVRKKNGENGNEATHGQEHLLKKERTINKSTERMI